MTGYEIIKVKRQGEQKIDESDYATAIDEQKKLVADLAIELGVESGHLKATHSLTPFDVTENQKKVAEISLNLTHEIQRLSKLVYWSEKANQGAE